MESFTDFEAAKSAAADGQRVCGTYIDKVPHYFLVPEGATDDDIHDAAFALRHGREMGEYERYLLSLVKAQREAQPA